MQKYEVIAPEAGTPIEQNITCNRCNHRVKYGMITETVDRPDPITGDNVTVRTPYKGLFCGCGPSRDYLGNVIKLAEARS